MSGSEYAYVIILNGVPIGGGPMKYHVFHSLEDYFRVGFGTEAKLAAAQKVSGLINDGTITVWRLIGPTATNITDNILIQHEKNVAKLLVELRGEN